MEDRIDVGSEYTGFLYYHRLQLYSVNISLEEAVEGWVVAHPSWLGWATNKFRIGGEQEWGLVAGVQVEYMFHLPDHCL